MRAIVQFEGLATRFHIEDERDHIQEFHGRGEFYELRHLLIQRDLIHRRSSVIDVGANVGNHTLFYSQHTNAVRVYPLEANPAAVEILRKNVSSNNTRATIDMQHLGIAVGGRMGRMRVAHRPDHNLGGTTLAYDEAGSIIVAPLDDLQFEGPLSLLKIDVEGGELDVLVGAEKLISKWRPAIAIEVQRENEATFWAWTRERGYQPISAFFDYVGVRNYVLISAQ